MKRRRGRPAKKCLAALSHRTARISERRRSVSLVTTSARHLDATGSGQVARLHRKNVANH